MSASMLEQSPEAGVVATQVFAEFLQAYLACNERVQDIVRRNVEFATSAEVEEDLRVMALHTVYDALFPESSPYDGLPGIDLDDLERFATGEMKLAFEELDREKAAFAERLRAAMTEKGMTQAQLAEAVGIDQPAVSGLLNRQWRPQSRTVAKIAEALGMRVEELWPTGE